MTPPAPVPEAYRECERITREQARNFSYGIRLLPGPKRRALCAVYAFARRVDDIGDGDLPTEEKLRQLKQARAALQSVSIDSSDPVLAALADTAERLPLPLSAFHELIDGCAADVQGCRYGTFDELLTYCRSVAGSIGRLSLAVFGSDNPARDAARADALGVALQLTNILRDVREDYRAGRVYLPSEDLAAFDIRLEPPVRGIDEEAMPDGPENPVTCHRFPLDGDDLPAWDALMSYQVRRAESWYAEGARLLPALDRRSRACCAAMAGIYHQLLHRITARPRLVLVQRTSLPGWRKVGVAARSLAGGTS